MSFEWKDTTSYSKGRDRTPRTWTAQIGVFQLVVTRHIHYPENAWLAMCDGIGLYREMESTKLREAQYQAVALLQIALQDALEVIAGK